MTQPERKAGDTFGRWTLVEYAGLDKHKQHAWKVRCECGTVGTRALTKMVSGQSRSCGCLRRAKHASLMSTLSGGK